MLLRKWKGGGLEGRAIGLPHATRLAVGGVYM